MTPWYRKHGKILTIVTDQEFAEGMEKGHFVLDAHRGYPVILYYSAVRKLEALRAVKEQFVIKGGDVFFDVGPRLKKIRRTRRGKRLSDEQYIKVLTKKFDRITTTPLPLALNAPFMKDLVRNIEQADEGERVFPWSLKTAYNIIDRVFSYPHLFRLSRITWFFMPHPEVGRARGFSIPEVRTYTGLSLAALDYYIGRADIADMGRALYFEQRGA